MAEPARAGPGSPATPGPRRAAPGQVFEDLTNTPSPLDRPEPALAEAAAGAVGGRRQPQRRRLQLQDAPMLPDYSMQPDGVASTAGPPQQPVQRAARAAQPDQRTAGPAPRARVALQRYSLKSRRAAPYPVPCLPKSAESLSRGAQVPQVSLQALWPPRGVTAHVQGSASQCGCSGDPFLSQGRRRLCLLDTEDHAEYQLLEAMGGLFAAETHSCSTSVSKRASMQMIQASFIVQPREGGAEDVVGYVAMRPGGSGGDAELAPTLVELYVMPEFRRRGLATAALKVLLAGCRSVAVGPPAPEVAGAVLRGLGFKAVDPRDGMLASCGGGRCDEDDEAHGHRVLFRRRALQKEN